MPGFDRATYFQSRGARRQLRYLLKQISYAPLMRPFSRRATPPGAFPLGKIRFISHPGGWGQILAAVASFQFLSGQKKKKTSGNGERNDCLCSTCASEDPCSRRDIAPRRQNPTQGR